MAAVESFVDRKFWSYVNIARGLGRGVGLGSCSKNKGLCDMWICDWGNWRMKAWCGIQGRRRVGMALRGECYVHDQPDRALDLRGRQLGWTCWVDTWLWRSSAPVASYGRRRQFGMAFTFGPSEPEDG
jgi:hypothetical protein